MARNAFGLALLAAVALSGCSQLDNLPFIGNKKAKEAEVRTAALRARTDSLRKARRAADSLSQVRFTACVDSVRAELVKPAMAVKKVKAKSKSRKAPPPPSEELIAAQAQSTCGSDAHAPMTIAATDSAAQKAPVKDSMPKTTVAAANAAAMASDSAKAVPAVAVKDTARIPAIAPAMDSAAVADSIQKARETEMYTRDVRVLRLHPRSVQLAVEHGEGGSRSCRPAAGRDLSEHAVSVRQCGCVPGEGGRQASQAAGRRSAGPLPGSADP